MTLIWITTFHMWLYLKKHADAEPNPIREMEGEQTSLLLLFFGLCIGLSFVGIFSSFYPLLVGYIYSWNQSPIHISNDTTHNYTHTCSTSFFIFSCYFASSSFTFPHVIRTMVWLLNWNQHFNLLIFVDDMTYPLRVDFPNASVHQPKSIIAHESKMNKMYAKSYDHQMYTFITFWMDDNRSQNLLIWRE